MSADESVYLKVEIETGDVSGLVWDLDVEDIDRGCDKVTFRMDNPNSVHSDALQEGETVRVSLGWGSEHAVVFEGIIHSVRAIAHQRPRVEVLAYDPSYRLTTGPRPASLQHFGTLEEILTAILRPHNIPIGSVRIDPMPSWDDDDELLQQNQNDWEFIQDLAEEYRSRAFVEVNATEGDSEEVRRRGGVARFYFWSEQVLLEQEPMGRLQYCIGIGKLLEFDYRRVGSGASPSSTITVTNPDTGESEPQAGDEPAAGSAPEASADRSARTSGLDGEGRAQSYEAAVAAAAAAETQPQDLRARQTIIGAPSSEELAARRIQQDPTRVLGFHGRGIAMGSIFLRAKGSVEIDGVATWANGRWYVSRVNHIVQRRSIEAENQLTQLTYRTRFVATR
jgi:phage protein D